MQLRRLVGALALVLVTAAPALAHFGMIIPDAPVATAAKRATTVTLSFSHPFEGYGMNLERPQAFGVLRVDGDKTERTDLLAALKEAKVMGKTAWKTDFTFPRPGVYMFTMEPKLYWEPEEDCYIQHLTKVVVPAFGNEDGWDTPAGLKFEIIPLTRPFGNYAGGVFTGVAMLDGKPVPGVDVEVEYYNAQGKYAAPTEFHVTQVVRTDANGVFTVACPLAGWWGFAALTTAPEQVKGPDGAMKDVEIGAVLWTRFDAFKSAK
jgi:cobalt/nickel transport protein